MTQSTESPPQTGSGRISGSIIYKILLLIAALVVMTSCAARSERAYSRQQLVVSELSWSAHKAEEEGNFDAAEVLYDAEDELKSACAPIQHAGYLRAIEEVVVGFWLGVASLFSLDDCEDAIASVKEELSRFEIKETVSAEPADPQ